MAHEICFQRKSSSSQNLRNTMKHYKNFISEPVQLGFSGMSHSYSLGNLVINVSS